MSYKWEDPQVPCELLRKNFTETAGVFRRKDNTYVPTPEEEEALDFLFLEWDFAYEHEPESHEDYPEPDRDFTPPYEP